MLKLLHAMGNSARVPQGINMSTLLICLTTRHQCETLLLVWPSKAQEVPHLNPLSGGISAKMPTGSPVAEPLPS